MAQGDDAWGWIIGLALVAGAGWLLYEKYEIRERTQSEATELEPVPLYRPTGLLHVSTLDNGTTWQLDADTVTGPRDARQVWVIEDHSDNAKIAHRETSVLYRINCDTTAYRVLSIVEYDKDGKVVTRRGSEEFSPIDSYPPPRSLIAGVVMRGCWESFDEGVERRPTITIPPPAPPLTPVN